MKDLSSNVSILERRFAALERNHRRWLACCSAIMVASLAAVLVAFAHPLEEPETVRASRFELVDKDGVVRGEWNVGERGEPSFRLLDAASQSRYEVMLKQRDQVVVRMRDDKDHARLSWILDRGTPHMLMTDVDQKPRVQMAVALSGAPSLVFIHKDGQMSAGVGIHADGEPWSKPAGGK